MMRKCRIIPVICGAAVLLFASGCSDKQKKTEKQLFAMDTYMSFTAYGKKSEQAVNAAVKEVERLEKLFSAHSEGSEVFLINQDGTGSVSYETAQLIQRGKEICEKTEGFFDLTIYPLMELWGFYENAYKVPSEDEITKRLPLVDSERVKIEFQEENAQISLGEGQKLDLGGIAKGYTSQKLMDLFQEYGVSSALVSLGGNVQTIGKKPDGTSWKVGIRDPKGSQQEYIGILSVQDEAVVTSGGYERFFEENGKTYIHILNPKTGYPAESDLLSVTIVLQDGALADGLSTALYVMGFEEAVRFWKKNSSKFEMILITDTEEIYVTEKLTGKFSSEKKWEILKSVDEMEKK